jgi:hypothetical protein
MDLLEIAASGPVLCDGGWGTELQKRLPVLVSIAFESGKNNKWAGARAIAGLCG